MPGYDFEIHTRQFNLHFRNFQTGPEHDEAMQKTMDWGFDEDRAVIAYLQPPLAPSSMGSELKLIKWRSNSAASTYGEHAT
ncbi:MAG: hypothetical protein CL799_11960 [Chromatiales bacterium]|jgi:hypothetical protein|nr:hypothetical protein [Chromatiales bacterium]